MFYTNCQHFQYNEKYTFQFVLSWLRDVDQIAHKCLFCVCLSHAAANIVYIYKATKCRIE